MKKTIKLLTPEREKLIIHELESGARTIRQLSSKLGVSSATVRRDLLSLEYKGKLERIHGGAVRKYEKNREPVFEEKENIHINQKKKIAEFASTILSKNEVIFLDGGSTILELAKKLKTRNDLTIVTNSIMALCALMDSGNNLILIGGKFRPISRTIVGPLSSKILNDINFTTSFIGTIGFNLEDGITTSDPDEAYTKEFVIKRSNKVILLADSSKLGTKSFVSSGHPNDIDILITDKGISANFAKKLSKIGVKIIKT